MGPCKIKPSKNNDLTTGDLRLSYKFVSPCRPPQRVASEPAGRKRRRVRSRPIADCQLSGSDARIAAVRSANRCRSIRPIYAVPISLTRCTGISVLGFVPFHLRQMIGPDRTGTLTLHWENAADDIAARPRIRNNNADMRAPDSVPAKTRFNLR